MRQGTLLWLLARIWPLVAAPALFAAATLPTTRPASDVQPAQADVYVPDSPAAMDQLTLADRMAARGQWETACSLVQEVLNKYADKVAPAPGRLDAQGKAVGYIGMAEAVRQRIAHWPADGRQAYRNRYEAAAHRLLEEAGREIGKLEGVARLYLQTPSGVIAAMRLMDLRIDQGQMEAAAWVGNQLLKWEPDLSTRQRGEVIYRLAWANHLSGRAQEARHLLEQLEQLAPPPEGMIGGKRVDLAQSLRQALAGGVVISPERQTDWPTPGGSANRAHVAPSVPSIGSQQYRIPLVRPPQSTQTDESPPSRMRLVVEPAVADGQLFFQDGQRLYAVDMDGAMPIGGWAATYGGSEGRFELGNQRAAIPAGAASVTIGPDAVYAVMGGNDFVHSMGFRRRRGGRESHSRLVCLDRRTGQARWIASPDELSGAPAAKSMEFSGNPIVQGGNVYVLGRGDTGTFQSCYAICLDARTGHPRWVTYVAGSASAGGAPFGVDLSSLNPQSQPALSQGVLYVATDNGVVGAVDAATGDPRWLSLYPHQSARPDLRTAGGATLGRLLRPWTANPAIISNGRLFVLPADSDQLFVYNAADGRELLRIPRQSFGDADTLLGVWGDWLILTGQNRAWAVNWRRYDPGRGDHADAIVRSADLSPIRGRGVITTDALFVPTERQLKRIALTDDLPKRGLMVVENYPPHDQPWPAPQEPGNLVIAEDHLIVAGADGVSVYADWKRLSQRMSQAIKASPDDPRLRLRYARALIAAGQAKAGLAQMDRVIGLLGARSTDNDLGHQELFNGLLVMARRAIRSGDAAVANELLQRVSNAVRTPEEQVNYLLARATLAHRQKAWSQEIQLLRSILADPDLRVVSVQSTGGSGPSLPASEAAAGRIAALLRTPEGRTAYAPIERQAKQAFEAARNRQDPKALLAVARDYPNAAVAIQAYLDAAQVHENRRNWPEARGIVRRVLVQDGQRRLHDRSDAASLTEAVQEADKASATSVSGLSTSGRLRLLEALARIDLQLNRPLNASARLAGAARMDPAGRLHESLTAPNGAVFEKSLSYADAARAITAKVPPPVPPLPAFTADHQEEPFVTDTGATVPGVTALIQPLPGFERFDRVIAWAKQGQVLLIQPGQATPLATIRMPEQPKGCAWIGTRLILWGDRQLLAIDGTTGRPLWEWSLDKLNIEGDAAVQAVNHGPIQQEAKPAARPPLVIGNGPAVRAGPLGEMPTLQPAPIDHGRPSIKLVRPAGRRLLLTTSAGRLICLRTDRSELVWQQRPTHRSVERLLTADGFAAVRVVEPEYQSLIVYDIDTGRPVFHRMFADSQSQSLINFTLGPQGVLVYTTRRGLVGKDLYQGGDQPTFQTVPRQGDDGRPRRTTSTTYMGMVRPDQLLIAGNQILSLGDFGRFVRVHSLIDGRLLTHHDRRHNRDVPAVLSTGTQGWEIGLRAVAGRFYAMGTRTIACFGLPPTFDATEQWRWRAAANNHFQQLTIGRTLLAIIGRPDAAQPPQIHCFSRQSITGGRESGLLKVVVPLPPGADWTPVNGGFYYIQDGAAHYLKGS